MLPYAHTHLFTCLFTATKLRIASWFAAGERGSAARCASARSGGSVLCMAFNGFYAIRTVMILCLQPAPGRVIFSRLGLHAFFTSGVYA